MQRDVGADGGISTRVHEPAHKQGAGGSDQNRAGGQGTSSMEETRRITSVHYRARPHRARLQALGLKRDSPL